MSNIDFDKLQKDALNHFSKNESDLAYDCWNKAMSLCENSIKDDTISTLWYNMGLARSQKTPGNGFEEYVHAIKNAKTTRAANEAKWNLSLCLLYNNEHLGWMLYDTRFMRSTNDGVKFTQLPIPYISMSYDSTKSIEDNTNIWMRNNIIDKHILILDEQGFGDSIMFASVWSTIASMAKSVIIQCKPELLSLYECSFAQFANVEFIAGTKLPNRAVMSRDGYTYAGTAFGMMFNKYKNVKYLRASDAKIQLWNDIINPSQILTKKIGFNLLTNQQAGNAVERSAIEHAIQKKIAIHCDAIGAAIIPISPTSMKFANLSITPNIKNKITDFEDSAAIMSVMDEVVSVSTASAHLAGAIGVNTKIYYRDDTNEWRWSKLWRMYDDVNRSMIYPSVELIDISTLN